MITAATSCLLKTGSVLKWTLNSLKLCCVTCRQSKRKVLQSCARSWCQTGKMERASWCGGNSTTKCILIVWRSMVKVNSSTVQISAGKLHSYHVHFYSSEDQPCRAVLWRNDPGRHLHGKALQRNVLSVMLVSNASIVWSFVEEANWLQNPDSHPGILWRSAHHDHHPDCLCISPSEAMQRKPGMKRTGPKWPFVVGIRFQ